MVERLESFSRLRSGFLAWLASGVLRVRSWTGSLLILSATLGAMALLYFLGLWDRDWSTYGYVGIFITTLVATGGLLFPVPYLAAVFAGGALLNPWITALVAAFAAATGELTGYALGWAGHPLVVGGAWYERVQKWMRARGFLTLVIMSLIPNPLFDVVGAMAGTTRYPLGRFWLAAFIGKGMKFVLVALAGSLFPSLLATFR